MMPPIAPRFIESSADDGTTMTVESPLRIVSYSMFMPAQMERGGMRAVQLASLGELLRDLDFAFAQNDPRLLLAFRLGHARQRVLQVVGHLDVAQLDRLDLDAPRLGLLVEDDRELLVQLTALREHRRQIVAADDVAQARPARRP